ncbi:hypothetical protein [Aeromicrobium alkaliterrae]|uniref:DUF3533 domain-containing protein n=1 Tax=Aeromicrobium alkaliterrae TaxID=302168 RepID=A0ABP4W336_9ACTN
MSGARRVVPLLVLALQAAVVLTLLLARPTSEPHGARVAIVAPPVVAATLVDRLGDDTDGDVRATASPSTEVALDDLDDGLVDAVVVVDLTVERDVLHVSPANGTRLNAALLREATATTALFGRTVDVVTAQPAPVSRVVPFLTAAAAVVLGFAVVVAAAWRSRSRVGVVATSGTAVVGGTLLGAAVAVGSGEPSALVPLGLASGLSSLTAAAVTLLLLRLLGAWGLGVAAAVFLLTTAPLIRATHPLLLASPWREVTPWLPHGAAADLTSDVLLFGSAGDPRSWTLLLGYVALAFLTLALVRSEAPEA